MGTKSPVMMSELGVSGFGGGDDLEKEFGLLLREQRKQEASDRERELNIFRSGSAPPTVEGSLSAIAGLNGNEFLSEEELRADPAYLSYYYSHVNLNPRLPPPVLSKEDWRSTQRLGGIGDRRKSGRGKEMGVGGGGGSLFNRQPGFEKREENAGGEWVSGGGDGLIGLSLGRQKSFAEIFQDDTGRTTSVPDYTSRPSSRSALDGGEPICSSETRHALHHEIASAGLQPGRNAQNMAGLHNKPSQTFASVLASSLSRNSTPDPQQLSRAPSPSLPTAGVRLGLDNNKFNNGSHSFNGAPSDGVESDDLLAALSGMKLSSSSADDISQSKRQQDIDSQRNFFLDLRSSQNCVKQHPFSKSMEPGHSNVSPIPNSAKSSYLDSPKSNISLADFSNSALRSNVPVELHRPTVSSNSYLNAPLAHSVGSPGSSPAHYQKADTTNATATSYGLSGYSINPALPQMLANHIGTGNLPPLFENAAAASAFAALGMDSRALGGGFSLGRSLNGSTELQSPNRIGNHSAAAAALQMQLVDPHYIQCLKTAEYAAQAAAMSDPSMERGYLGSSYPGLLGMQEAYLGALQHHKQYGAQFLGKTGPSSPGYYGNPAFGLNMSYPGSPLASPIPASPIGPCSPVRHAERNIHFHPGLSNFAGGIMGSWNPGPNGSLDDGFPSTLLEEFKSTKTRCFELSDIASHVVEFSADQYGSRFIQQKLETATTEEKDMVFEEIMPQALSLMTDVFGNYVVQKFFEHGSTAQIRELANQLNGHVLALSLQMYGCRVIQKKPLFYTTAYSIVCPLRFLDCWNHHSIFYLHQQAIEVVDLDQQTKMVAELDGHIMRCVRDQNGNHVIQKCIECIPQESIQFIISSFYDHVVTLSTHPYGCRVIQRVLEHCDDTKTQQIVMDEIMQCVCMLAQDQYGNYVVQHVLEHGKPHERSVIIKQLAGQIVKMSQQKFASNVVEKCLTFGGPDERQILVNEMLGSTDENEPLQAMMKDQFANYVVQKVLETCDDQQRELILSRIKVHLNALKKYTYGKHIVARVEKLVAAGERRIGLQSSYPS